MTTFQCLTHDVHVTDAFEAVVDAATSHLDQVVDDVVDLAGVHEISHTELGSQFFFVGIEIDTDDAASTHQLGALDYIEADATQAKYGDCCTGLYLHGERDGADARGHTATDVTDFVEGRVLTHFCERDFREYGVVRECGATHVMQDGLAIE